MRGVRLLIVTSAAFAAPMVLAAATLTAASAQDCSLAGCDNSMPESELVYSRGLKALDRGDIDQAIIEFGAAIELDPSDVILYLKRADAYEKKGERENALADYRKAATVSHDSDLIKNINTAIRRLASKR